MSRTFPEIQRRVEAAEAVLVLSHDRPDGDAIGSMVALGMILEDFGKRVRLLNNDAVPESLRFLPGADRVERPGDPVEADLVFALDSAGRDRIDESVWEVTPDGVPLVVVDHHISNDGFGDISHVDAESPATGQILFELARSCGWRVSREAAINLYAAISTDTGSFRYPSTTAHTMRVGSELISLGVDVGWTNRMIYENQPRRRVEILRRLLDDLRFDCDERCASVALPLEVTEELHLQPGDTEGVIDILRSVDSVIIAAFFEELPDGRIRVSSRSKREDCGVGEICSQFGGGGHTLAAGARLPGPLEEARNRFMRAVGVTLSRI